MCRSGSHYRSCRFRGKACRSFNCHAIEFPIRGRELAALAVCYQPPFFGGVFFLQLAFAAAAEIDVGVWARTSAPSFGISPRERERQSGSMAPYPAPHAHTSRAMGCDPDRSSTSKLGCSSCFLTSLLYMYLSPLPEAPASGSETAEERDLDLRRSHALS